MNPLTKGALAGAVAGALYGLAVYLWLHVMDGEVGVMIASYLFLVPFVLGMLTPLLLQRSAARPPPEPDADSFGEVLPPAPHSIQEFVLVTILNVTVFLFVALIVGIEGLLCAFIAAPVMYVMAFLGALLMLGIMKVLRSWRGRVGSLLFSAALPVVLGPLEQARTPPVAYRTVTNTVLIQAPPAAVWAQIRSVPRIQDSEIQRGWVHAVGLPRPREAVMNRDGVGAVRVATFDGGLSFLETVTDWQENRELAFRIQARDPGNLDPHVRVGGRFFDVLSGVYRLEEVQPGLTLLHLSSTQRVSTPFNGYTAFFTQAIMRDLQRTILAVVRNRAEGVQNGQLVGTRGQVE